MTERRGNQLPWWEFDPDEKPVPMTGARWEAADDAELIANAEREAILREDTKPSLVTLGQLAATQEPCRCPSRIPVTRRIALAASVALVVGCAGAFSLGWLQGDSLVQPGDASMTRTTGSHNHPDPPTGWDLLEKTGKKGDGR